MPTLDNLATRFAHCVSLFRDPTAKAGQKKEFRALLGLLQDTAVTLRLAQGGSGIEVNGVPCEGEGVAVLVERLDLHGIGEIALPANPPPAQLFELLQALADQPGAHDVTSRLAAAGADRIRIAPVGQPPAAATPRGPVASSEDFGAREPVIPNPDTPVDRKSGALGTAGILRGESMRDIKSVPLQGVPLVTHDPPPPKAADALPGVVDRASPRRESGADGLLSLSSERQAKPAPPRAAPTPPPSAPPPAPPPSQPDPPPVAKREAAHAPASRATPTGRVALPPGAVDVLADLERNSTSPTVGDLLAALIDLAASAAKLGRFEQVLGVISGITRVEEKVSEASGVRRQYTIALRRIYTKPVLEGLSRLLAAPKHRAASSRERPSTACGAQAPGRRGGGPAARRRRGRGGADGCTGGSTDGGRAACGVRRLEAHDGGDGPARPHAGAFAMVRGAQRGGADRRAGDGRCRPGARQVPGP